MKALGLLFGLSTAELTWPGWLGVAGVLMLVGLFILAKERARRLTLTAVVGIAGPGTFVMDRRRGRTLIVLKPFDARRDVAVVLVSRRYK